MTLGYKPDEISMFNPNRKYPRNLPCPCHSGKKFKVCCLPKQPHLVRINKDTTAAEKIMSGIKKAYKEKRK